MKKLFQEQNEIVAAAVAFLAVVLVQVVGPRLPVELTPEQWNQAAEYLVQLVLALFGIRIARAFRGRA